MTTHIIRGRSLVEHRTPPGFPARPGWMFHPDRPCKDKGDLWTSDDKHELNEAAKQCRTRGCPVLQECGRWAVENGEKHHVWGGLNFSTAELRAVVDEAAGRAAGASGRHPDRTIEQEVRRLWGQGLSDATIALRLDKVPGHISNVRRRLGLKTLYGPGGRRVAA